MKEILMNGGIHLWNLLNGVKKEHRLMLSLMALWSVVTEFFSSPEISTGINQSVPIMIVLSLISFLALVHLCWWLLQRFWLSVGLPGLSSMVLQFSSLELWKQLGFFWLSFALLLLTGLGCLVAIL
ncbi:hypothetical protein [Pedobacter ginsengisoli]|uniref:hypothetical protein n=1 Tax=Pedobacter ginsengisoli TaxID=363852 RepID=UPI002549C84A|nr:hypothetical protein [Pedobacter ginsengisoli]